MIFQLARYAFKALIVLARAGSAGMQIRDIAMREQIPRKFLEQILLTLKAGGLIASRRGREGGDAKVRKELQRWQREFHDQTGHTTLFVTHDQDEAFELADRVAILNAGRVEQVASPRIIQAKPASPFVAAFVEGDRAFAGTREATFGAAELGAL